MCAPGIATIIAIAACGSTAPAKAPRTAAAYAPETWASSSSTTVGSGDATSTSVTSYTVTVSKLADSTGQQANMTVNYRCGLGVAPCVWSSEASQYSGRTCPSEFHPTRSIWTGPIQQNAGTEYATVTFQPLHGVARPQVCVYVDDGG